MSLLRRRPILLALVLAAAALVLPDRHGIRTFHAANSAARVYPVQSFVHYGSWSFEGVLCRTAPEFDLFDLSLRDGKPLTPKAPGLSWAGIPVYALAASLGGGHLPFHWTETLLALVCVFLPTLLLAGALGRHLMAAHGPRAAALSVCGLLLASPMFVYAGMFMDYALASMLLPVGYLLLRSRGRWARVGAGLVLGTAVTVNYAFLAYGGTVGLVDLVRRIRARDQPLLTLGLAAAGAAGPLVALAVYHQVVFGGPLTTGYAFLAQAEHQEGLAQATLSGSALLASFIGPKTGFFFHTPWTLFGLVGLAIALVSRPEHRWDAAAACCAIGANLVFSATWSGSNPDEAAFGRHLVPSLPWLAWGLACFLGPRGRPASPALRAALSGGLVGTVALAAAYAFVTGWTYPYHPRHFADPLWQLNLPLFFDGFYLPVVWPAPGHVPGEAAFQHAGIWVGLSAALGAAAFAAAWRAGAEAREPGVRPLLSLFVFPLAAFGVAVALGVWGAAVNPGSPAGVEAAQATIGRLKRGEPVSDHERAHLERWERDQRGLRLARDDVALSYTVPDDPTWRDEGWPQNRWCKLALR